MLRYAALNLLTGTSIFLLTGCGDSKKLVEVNGVATHAGKPLANVTLNFVDPNGWTSSGQTDTEGRFTLRIMSSAPTLEARTCKVWVSLPSAGKKEDTDGKAASKAKRAPGLQNLLRKYGDTSSTPKTVEITETELKIDLD